MSISGLMTPLHIIPKLTFKILAHLCSVLPVVTGKNPYLLWGITALSPCHLLCLVLELPPYQVLEVPHQPISIYPPQHRLNGAPDHSTDREGCNDPIWITPLLRASGPGHKHHSTFSWGGRAPSSTGLGETLR